MPRDKDLLLEDITEYIDYDSHDWSDFLLEDCQEFVESLHSFRLAKLRSNREKFVDYIDELEEEYHSMLDDNDLRMQAQTTVQALFSLSCSEFASGSKERMILREKVER